MREHGNEASVTPALESMRTRLVMMMTRNTVQWRSDIINILTHKIKFPVVHEIQNPWQTLLCTLVTSELCLTCRMCLHCAAILCVGGEEWVWAWWTGGTEWEKTQEQVWWTRREKMLTEYLHEGGRDYCVIHTVVHVLTDLSDYYQETLVHVLITVSPNSQ